MNSTNTETGKILIVDDDHYSLMIVKEILISSDYQVSEALNTTSIIEQVIEEEPDLILLDMFMPQLNTLDLCQTLKQHSKTYLIPIIFMSVKCDYRSRLKCIEAGAVTLLSKPIDHLELSTMVKSLVEQKRLNENLGQTKQVLFNLAKAIENRKLALGNSATKLPNLAKGFSEHLQLKEQEIQNLMDAAYLHDIGNVAIPDSIMQKTGELTSEEREILNQHVLIGEEICQPIKDLRGVLPIIRHHHERWDGSGYPDGLKEEEIPFLAQVFQIIDIYDALTSKRPHKEPLTPEQALNIIVEEGKKGWRNRELVSKFSDFILATESLTVGVKVLA